MRPGRQRLGPCLPAGGRRLHRPLARLLARAGGKPVQCPLGDFTQGGGGAAKPEFIVTFRGDARTVLVVECMNSSQKHQSPDLDRPRGFAVDGALYYAKFLKEDYGVVAVAVSGTGAGFKASAFHWPRGQETFAELRQARDILLEPAGYLRLVRGERVSRAYSLDEIRALAIQMHDCLREIKVTEAHKPIFIAGVLIALSDEDFDKMYPGMTSFRVVMQNLQSAIEGVLRKNGIKSDRAAYIQQVFRTLQDNTKFAAIPLVEDKSILWYVGQLAVKIRPMIDHADSTLDALGVFYHEFIQYSGGDGSGLGIVLTPQHLTEFMCEVAGVHKNSRVLDICCGSGSFLVSAMSLMFRGANPRETERIRREQLFGVEFDDGLYTLAVANMIVRRDGKSNIYKGDCFNEDIGREIKAKNATVGLINPPYSQTDLCGLEFVERLLDLLVPGGTGVAVVPMSCAIGTKFEEVRERLFKRHTLKAVFSMPDDIFYPMGTNPCVMAWEAHAPHDSRQETFFGYYKNDGFVKRKKLGRVDAHGTWQGIKERWLALYRNRDVVEGLSARRRVTHGDEWLCEAYMETDYSLLTAEHFEKTIRDYLAYQIANALTGLAAPARPWGAKRKSGLVPVSQWGTFRIGDFFNVKRGKRIVRDRDYLPPNQRNTGTTSSPPPP